MRYAQIRKYDVANGVGVRTVLFVSGCSHKCRGCFNEEYQDFRYGEEWNKEVEDQVVEYVSDKNVRGLTVLGGEPMQQVMDRDLVTLLKRVKEETGKEIWLFSGYTLEQILEDNRRKEILSYCDVLVDGPFVEGLKDFKLRFRGSSNQRILDVQKSIESNTPIFADILE